MVARLVSRWTSSSSSSNDGHRRVGLRPLVLLVLLLILAVPSSAFCPTTTTTTNDSMQYQRRQGVSIITTTPPRTTGLFLAGVFSEDPTTIFQRLQQQQSHDDGDDATITVETLIRGDHNWKELRDILDDGDMTEEELIQLCPAPLSRRLTLPDLIQVYTKINDLFEEEDDEDENHEGNEKEASNMTEEGPPISSIKETLLEYLQETIRSTENLVRLPCGLDCEDRERALIQNGITALEQEQQQDNWIVTKQGRLSSEDVMGTWDLLYTSSRTMMINKSLSGLGRSTSEKATLQGIQMRLTGNKFLGQAEFVEVFGSNDDDNDDDDSISLEVSVVGEWMLEKSRNIFTGAPSSSLRVLPETISYGVSKNKADEWASLGPIKLVDILYCDSDLMVVRGTANTESHFIYQRNQQPNS